MPVRSTASDCQHLAKKVGEGKCLFGQCWSSMTIRQFARLFANSSLTRETLKSADRPKMAARPSKKHGCRPDCDGPFHAAHDGLEETRILRKLMPAVTVIIYFSHTDPFVEKEAVASGASAVVSKSDAVVIPTGKARELLGRNRGVTVSFPVWES